MIGIVGPHRCGKSTLARAYADKNGATFVETSVSAMFKDMGYSPSGTFDFATRLTIQEEILKRIDVVYAGVKPGSFAITDRTPLDLLGYTMAEAAGDAVPAALQDRFEQYVTDCFDVLNKRFSMVVLVQPGIPLVEAEGKAALNRAYIEHLSAIMFGLMMGERTKCARFYIRRLMLDLDERVAALESAAMTTEHQVHQEIKTYINATGGRLQ
jgi:hypothetical protein